MFFFFRKKLNREILTKDLVTKRWDGVKDEKC